MANFPTITYTNLKHKVDNGISGGVIQSKDEAITLVFNNGIGTANKYRASFNSPHNQITGTLNSNRELSKWQVRVTPIEVDDFGPEVGNRATIITGISANIATNFTIPITQAVFTGSPTNTYRLCLMGQSSLDYSWDCTQLFMVIDNNTSFTNTYTEVEYLECTGTQYINTNVTYANNLQILDTISYTSLNFNGVAYVINGIDQTVYWGLINQNGRYYFTCGGHSTIIPTVNQKYNLKIDTNTKSLYLDDTLIATRTAGINGSGNMYLFATKTYNATSTSYFSNNMRRYACKFYQNGTLIRDFVPCIRNSDNKPGMYDRVNNTFYTNAGSGEFKYGPLKSVPATYQQVEYIGSTGTQTIDTGYNLTSNNFIFEDIYEYAALTNNEACIGGTAGIFEFGNTGSKFFNWSANKSSSAYGPGTPAINTKYHYKAIVSASQYSCTIDDVGGTPIVYNHNSIGKRIYINRYYSNAHQLNGKQYMVRIWDNGLLVRDYLPCYRKSDNVIGMLDMVNNVFYTNAGSGTFTKGNNVSNKNYIKYKPTDSDGYDVHFVN